MTSLEVQTQTRTDDPKVKQSGLAGTNHNANLVKEVKPFRHWITADGSSGYKAEAGRYHLYVSLACPWAHRTLMVRQLKGLEDVISYTVVDWLVGARGWSFTDKKPKCSLDPINKCLDVRQMYEKCDPAYKGDASVPVLWDKQTNTLVNNESGEIIRMFNSEFQAFCKTPEQRNLDLYPQKLRAKIDELNAWISPKINHGVYTCGFAKSQSAYDEAVKDVFDGLDKIEQILSGQRYLTGAKLTEADVRLFATLIRFDTAYHTHFKTNKKRIVDYPNIWGYVRDIYQLPGVAQTVDQEHIMKCYYESNLSINPTGIVAAGPDLDLLPAHLRDKL